MMKPTKENHRAVTSKLTSQFTSKKLMIACKMMAAVRINKLFMQDGFKTEDRIWRIDKIHFSTYPHSRFNAF